MMISTQEISVPEAYRETSIPGILSLKLSAPLMVQYELTAGCNQACIFCYNVWKTRGKNILTPPLSTEDKVRIMEKIVNWKVFDMVFSGGEPLIDNDLPLLIKIAEEGGMETSIITNGGLLTENLCKQLKQAGLRGAQISLHDADPEVNDSIAGKRGAYFDTIAGVRSAVEILGGDNVSINMVLTSINHLDVMAMAKLSKELGVTQFSIGSLSETGNAKATGCILTKEQFQESYRLLRQAEKEIGIPVGISGGFPLCILKEIDCDPLRVVSNFCDAGLNQIVVAPNGDMRACVCLPQIIGNMLRDDPAKIWKESEFLWFLRKLEHIPPKCHNCNYAALCKGGCRAAALATYGSISSPDPLGEK